MTLLLAILLAANVAIPDLPSPPRLTEYEELAVS